MRKLVHTRITPAKFREVLTKWTDVKQDSGSTLAPNFKGSLLHYALPSEVTAEKFWHPNVGEFLTMVEALGDSRASRMLVLGVSQPSLSLRYKRWRTALASYDSLSKIRGQHDEVLTAQIAGLKRTLQKPVGICTYQGWLRILTVAGALDNEVVDSVPNKELRSIMMRMQQDANMYIGEVVALDFTEPSTTRANVKYKRKQVEPFLRMRGGIGIENGAFDRVSELPPVPFYSLVGGVVSGFHITGEVGDVSGWLFANCIFTDCAFQGSMDDVTFAGCDFTRCEIMSGVSAERVTMRSCEGYLSAQRALLAFFRAHDCEGLALDVGNGTVTDSYITDGWITCHRRGEVLEGNGQARNAPRNIARALWVNGGLDFDCESMTDLELYGNTVDDGKHKGSVRSMVKAVVPEAVWTGQLRSHYPPHDMVLGLDEVAKLFAHGGWSMRRLAEERWQLGADRE